MKDSNFKIVFYLQQGFKTFLGITPQVANWNATGDEFSLLFESNPLADFVELPEGHNNLWYSSLLVGVIKGSLEMVFLLYFEDFFIFYFLQYQSKNIDS